MDYPFDVVVAIDRVTGQRVTNGAMTLYAESDTGKTTPLPVLDSSKLPIPDGLIRTTSEAYVPKFWVTDHARVVGVSGSSEVTLVSTEGYKIAAETAATEAQEAKVAAQTAGATAADAAKAEVDAKIAAGELTGPQGKSAYQLAVDAGFVGNEAEWQASLHGRDGSNVLPTSEAISQEITTQGSPANTALTATTASAIAPVQERLANVARIANSLPAPGGLGGSSLTGGMVGAVVTTGYGVTAAGVPYFDTNGATLGEEAVLTPDPSSVSGLSLIKIGG